MEGKINISEFTKNLEAELRKAGTLLVGEALETLDKAMKESKESKERKNIGMLSEIST